METPPRRPFERIDYFAAYSYYFAQSNWFLSLLLVTLCQMIPIVGPIAVLGYEFEVILAKHRGASRAYPEFDFGRFPDYLSRGVWPFLAQLVVMLGLVPIVLVGVFGSLAMVGFLAAPANPAPMVIVAALPALLLLFLALMIAMSLVMTPLALRAGLTRDFGQAFNLDFIKDFTRRVGWETVLTTGFLIISGPIVMLAGMLICFVGVYFASTLVILAYTHFKWQLYELYLARGGQPIPLAEEEIVLAERA